MTAHDKIKKWLLRGYKITGGIAWRKFSCYRLSSVIHRLRKSGMNIETTMECAGTTYQFASYRIKK